MSVYKLFGQEMSPYSVKVRSYMRYKKIPHEWIVRSRDKMEEFSKYAKLPLIPCVVFPDEISMQDSTPIMDKLENLHPEPSVLILDPALNFISALIEEYADEWFIKTTFHHRWSYEKTIESSSIRIAEEIIPNGSEQEIKNMAQAMKDRMIGRLSALGDGEKYKENQEVIIRIFQRVITILEDHFSEHAYLFGGRPSMGDFGLFGQLYEIYLDQSRPELTETNSPKTVEWIKRMLDPKPMGEIAPWEKIEPGILRLLNEEIGAFFLPWSVANAKAFSKGEKEFSVQLGQTLFRQEAGKYPAKTLRACLKFFRTKGM